MQQRPLARHNLGMLYFMVDALTPPPDIIFSTFLGGHHAIMRGMETLTCVRIHGRWWMPGPGQCPHWWCSFCTCCTSRWSERNLQNQRDKIILSAITQSVQTQTAINWRPWILSSVFTHTDSNSAFLTLQCTTSTKTTLVWITLKSRDTFVISNIKTSEYFWIAVGLVQNQTFKTLHCILKQWTQPQTFDLTTFLLFFFSANQMHLYILHLPMVKSSYPYLPLQKLAQTPDVLCTFYNICI